MAVAAIPEVAEITEYNAYVAGTLCRAEAARPEVEAKTLYVATSCPFSKIVLPDIAPVIWAPVPENV